MKLLLLTKDLADNSTGRAQVLWTLARSLGWEAKVVAPVGDQIWLPARGSDFALDCEVIVSDRELSEIAIGFDLIIAVKPQPGSFGRAIKVASKTPLLLDIDDPDIESILSEGHPVKALVKSVLRPRVFWSAKRLRRQVAGYPVIVSNPVLQDRYGGEIIPHARHDSGPGNAHTASNPSVVFVGTNRRHKGLDVLRTAIRAHARHSFSLLVTDRAPADAQTNERWVGQTSLAEGLELVRAGDIVVIPSMPGEVHSLAQLPAKLIDAMIAGRAVVVADFTPLRWAIGETGLTFRPGSAESLGACLDQLSDPTLRRALGAASRARALELFSVDEVRRDFARVCEGVVSSRP